MKTTIQIVLWILALLLGIFGLLTLSGALQTSGTDAAGRGMEQAFGVLVCLVAGGAIAALVLARFWTGWLWVAGAIFFLPVLIALVANLGKGIREARNSREIADIHSGRADFAGQPALLAVAEAIARNDQPAIRVAAKAVPDLQASGRDGMTLLFFAVDQSFERPELVDAVETLLSLGAQPNFTSEFAESYALARAVNGPVRLLRLLLDAGGNPNARDPQGRPMIFNNWKLVIFETDQRARFHLLLDRGMEINSLWPESEPGFAGYTLAMFRASMGRGDGAGYVDALELLKRGADLKHVAKDGTTLVSLLREHRASLAQESAPVKQDYLALTDWLRAHGATVSEN